MICHLSTYCSPTELGMYSCWQGGALSISLNVLFVNLVRVMVGMKTSMKTNMLLMQHGTDFVYAGTISIRVTVTFIAPSLRGFLLVSFGRDSSLLIDSFAKGGFCYAK